MPDHPLRAEANAVVGVHLRWLRSGAWADDLDPSGPGSCEGLQRLATTVKLNRCAQAQTELLWGMVRHWEGLLPRVDAWRPSIVLGRASFAVGPSSWLNHAEI